jgi:RimJ/RimL family protein N-acetyltransferase
MLEGRRRHDHFHKGRWRDALCMSILEDEFRGRKDASG